MTATSTSPEIKIEFHKSPVSDADRIRALETPGFGKIFTDHMVLARWTADKGWHDAKVTARRPRELDPASAVLHYAQEIFEGMKAYKADDGRILLFRPEENARRFAQSAARMAMPAVPEELFLKAVEELVRVDKNWIPSGDASLYLRPFMFANEAFLGVRPAQEYIFCIIASPVGAYFKGGAKAVSLWVETAYTRAAAGGTGAAYISGDARATRIISGPRTRHDEPAPAALPRRRDRGRCRRGPRGRGGRRRGAGHRPPARDRRRTRHHSDGRVRDRPARAATHEGCRHRVTRRHEGDVHLGRPVAREGRRLLLGPLRVARRSPGHTPRPCGRDGRRAGQPGLHRRRAGTRWPHLRPGEDLHPSLSVAPAPWSLSPEDRPPRP